MPIDDKVFRLTASGGAPGSGDAPGSGGAPGRGGPTGAGGPLAKVLTWVVGGVALVGALVFSAALFVVLLVVGAAVGGWLWWQTRALRRQLRAQMEQMQQQAEQQRTGRPGAGPVPPGAGMSRRSAPGDGEIIDGDFIREAPAAPPGAASNDAPTSRPSAHDSQNGR